MVFSQGGFLAMASFEQHMNISIIGTGIVLAPLYSAGLIEMSSSIIALSLGIIGGMLPDLDSDNSKPLRATFKIVSTFVPLVLILLYFSSLSMLELVGLWMLFSIVLHVTLFEFFLKVTTHRGVFHTIPMGVVFGLLTFMAASSLFNVPEKNALLYGFFLSYGFILHLILDEIFSVNALGVSMKKSFGSALKMYDKKNMIGTFALYIFIGAFIVLKDFNFENLEDIVAIYKSAKVY